MTDLKRSRSAPRRRLASTGRAEGTAPISGQPLSTLPPAEGIRPARPVVAELLHGTDGTVFGWAYDPADLSRRLVVEIMSDGLSLAVVKADLHVESLRLAGHGDGCYGFAVAPDPRLQLGHLELLLANDDRVVARCVEAGGENGADLAAFSSGTVMWRGGLRLSGTLRDYRSQGAELPALQAYEGSKLLGSVLRLHVDERDAHGGVRYQFDLLLPVGCADGNLHMIRVVDEAGVELEGSPVAVLAHRHGFRGLVPNLGRLPKAEENLRHQTLAFLDQLIPASLPFEAYSWWSQAFAEAHDLDDAASDRAMSFVIIGRHGSEATLASLREQRGAFAIRAAILDIASEDHLLFAREKWRAVRSDLAAMPGAVSVVVRAGTSLKPHACLALAQAFDQAAGQSDGAMLCLADHALFDAEGGHVPLFQPLFDYERLLAQGYAEGIFAVDRLPELPGDPAEMISTYDVLLGALDDVGGRKGQVVQVPRILATVPGLAPAAAVLYLEQAVRRHLDRNGQAAILEKGQGSLFPTLHIRRPRPDGEVAIVVPTRDRLDLLRPCIASIEALTAHPDYRIVVIDNGSRDPETLDYLCGLQRKGATILRDDGPFNYSRLNNMALRDIPSPFACLLNNDVEVLAADWLGDMQSFFSRDDVGGVGAKLIWPNGMLQHGGVVLGMNFAAGHAYDRYLASEPGYADGILVARESAALTAACLLLRREDYLAVGGLDEKAFPVAFNDVDLCLKLRAAGKALIWSPRAELLHRESASRTSDQESSEKQSRFKKELAELRRRWAGELLGDSYYNPNLNLDAYGFSGLSLPPRSRSPRARKLSR